MIKIPSNSNEEGISPKNIAPRIMAHSKDEYLNGAVKLMSPKRTAATDVKYPNPIKTEAKTNDICALNSTGDQLINMHAVPAATVT